jgi:nucleoside-diphosphate-sugar epimerase
MGRMSGRLFCFGLGYVAQALAARLGAPHSAAQGWRIGGTVRGAGKAADLAAKGIAAAIFGRDHPLDPSALAGATHVLSSVPPDEHGDPVLNACGEMLPKGLSWIGYLSTTGVYGDRGGALVDETTPVAPGNERSRRRVAAESAWLELGRRLRVPAHVFRLAGIYGPGRSALDSIRAGTARRIEKPGQVFSRIHVDDIAAVLEASIARPHAGAIYNVADDEPAPPADVVAFAAELLGVPPPPLVPYEQAVLSPMSQSFFAENRRVSNARIRRELGVTLRYPTYREGLRALLAQGH